MKTIVTSHAPKAIGPYVQGTASGNLLFTSMQLPVDVASGDIPGGIEVQTQLVLMNLHAIAKAAGSSMAHALRITVYLKDMNDFPAMNEVYATFFKEGFPARTTIQVARIPKDALVAMDAIFEIPGTQWGVT